MSFISVFDVMGPNMIGPSSSHTAGAARIAYLAQKMINGPLAKVEFILYGSFARTYHGHGTDRALLGGIMGFSTDDMRIRNSFEIATENGLKYSFTPNEEETDIHPNTVDIIMTNTAGQEMTIRGESLGGGKVHITQINHVEVDSPVNTVLSLLSRRMFRVLLPGSPVVSATAGSILLLCVCFVNRKDTLLTRL